MSTLIGLEIIGISLFPSHSHAIFGIKYNGSKKQLVLFRSVGLHDPYRNGEKLLMKNMRSDGTTAELKRGNLTNMHCVSANDEENRYNSLPTDTSIAMSSAKTLN